MIQGSQSVGQETSKDALQSGISADMPADRTQDDREVPGAHRPVAPKKRSYARTALAGLFWIHTRTTAAALIAFPTTIILARLLSPSDFGIAAAAMFFGRLTARLTSMGMGAALIRTKVLRADHLATTFVFTAAVGTVAYVCLTLSAGAIASYYGTPELTAIIPFVGLPFLIASFFTIQQALLSRDLRYREMATSSTVLLLVTSGSSVIMAWAGLGYWSLVLAPPLGEVAKAAVSSYFVRWRPDVRCTRAAFSDLFSFGFGSYALTLLQHLAQNLDTLIIGRVLGVTPLGFYDKGYSFAHTILSKLTGGGPNLTFRIFSIIEDEPERFRRAYRKVILASTLVAYPALGVLAALAEPIFTVLLGERWLPAVLPFQILSVAMVLQVSNSYASAAAQARGWMWPQVWRSLVVVGSVSVLVYVLSRWGIAGAAVGVSASTIMGWVLMQQMLRRATGFSWGDILAPQLPAVTCSLGLIALVSLGRGVIGQVWPEVQAWPLLLALGGASAVAYVLFLRFSPFTEATSLVSETLTAISPRLGRLVKT